MRAIVRAIFIGLFLAVSGAGVSTAAEKAHKDDGHKHDDKQHKSHHGGVVAHVGHHEYELVAKADSLVLYVSEDEKPLPTKGGSANVTLTAGADKSTVKLEPAGENRFEAKGSFKVASGTRVTATVTVPGKKSEQIRFTLK